MSIQQRQQQEQLDAMCQQLILKIKDNQPIDTISDDVSKLESFLDLTGVQADELIVRVVVESISRAIVSYVEAVISLTTRIQSRDTFDSFFTDELALLLQTKSFRTIVITVRDKTRLSQKLLALTPQVSADTLDNFTTGLLMCPDIPVLKSCQLIESINGDFPIDDREEIVVGELLLDLYTSQQFERVQSKVACIELLRAILKVYDDKALEVISKTFGYLNVAIALQNAADRDFIDLQSAATAVKIAFYLYQCNEKKAQGTNRVITQIQDLSKIRDNSFQTLLSMSTHENDRVRAVVDDEMAKILKQTGRRSQADLFCQVQLCSLKILTEKNIKKTVNTDFIDQIIRITSSNSDGVPLTLLARCNSSFIQYIETILLCNVDCVVQLLQSDTLNNIFMIIQKIDSKQYIKFIDQLITRLSSQFCSDAIPWLPDSLLNNYVTQIKVTQNEIVKSWDAINVLLQQKCQLDKIFLLNAQNFFILPKHRCQELQNEPTFQTTHDSTQIIKQPFANQDIQTIFQSDNVYLWKIVFPKVDENISKQYKAIGSIFHPTLFKQLYLVSAGDQMLYKHIIDTLKLIKQQSYLYLPIGRLQFRHQENSNLIQLNQSFTIDIVIKLVGTCQSHMNLIHFITDSDEDFQIILEENPQIHFNVREDSKTVKDDKNIQTISQKLEQNTIYQIKLSYNEILKVMIVNGDDKHQYKINFKGNLKSIKIHNQEAKHIIFQRFDIQCIDKLIHLLNFAQEQELQCQNCIMIDNSSIQEYYDLNTKYLDQILQDNEQSLKLLASLCENCVVLSYVAQSNLAKILHNSIADNILLIQHDNRLRFVMLDLSLIDISVLDSQFVKIKPFLQKYLFGCVFDPLAIIMQFFEKEMVLDPAQLPIFQTFLPKIVKEVVQIKPLTHGHGNKLLHYLINGASNTQLICIIYLIINYSPQLFGNSFDINQVLQVKSENVNVQNVLSMFDNRFVSQCSLNKILQENISCQSDHFILTSTLLAICLTLNAIDPLCILTSASVSQLLLFAIQVIKQIEAPILIDYIVVQLFWAAGVTIEMQHILIGPKSSPLQLFFMLSSFIKTLNAAVVKRYFQVVTHKIDDAGNFVVAIEKIPYCTNYLVQLLKNPALHSSDQDIILMVISKFIHSAANKYYEQFQVNQTLTQQFLKIAKVSELQADNSDGFEAQLPIACPILEAIFEENRDRPNQLILSPRLAQFAQILQHAQMTILTDSPLLINHVFTLIHGTHGYDFFVRAAYAYIRFEVDRLAKIGDVEQRALQVCKLFLLFEALQGNHFYLSSAVTKDPIFPLLDRFLTNNIAEILRLNQSGSKLLELIPYTVNDDPFNLIQQQLQFKNLALGIPIRLVFHRLNCYQARDLFDYLKNSPHFRSLDFSSKLLKQIGAHEVDLRSFKGQDLQASSLDEQHLHFIIFSFLVCAAAMKADEASRDILAVAAHRYAKTHRTSLSMINFGSATNVSAFIKNVCKQGDVLELRMELDVNDAFGRDSFPRILWGVLQDAFSFSTQLYQYKFCPETDGEVIRRHLYNIDIENPLQVDMDLIVDQRRLMDFASGGDIPVLKTAVKCNVSECYNEYEADVVVADDIFVFHHQKLLVVEPVLVSYAMVNQQQTEFHICYKTGAFIEIRTKLPHKSLASMLEQYKKTEKTMSLIVGACTNIELIAQVNRAVNRFPACYPIVGDIDAAVVTELNALDATQWLSNNFDVDITRPKITRHKLKANSGQKRIRLLQNHLVVKYRCYVQIFDLMDGSCTVAPVNDADYLCEVDRRICRVRERYGQWEAKFKHSAKILKNFGEDIVKVVVGQQIYLQSAVGVCIQAEKPYFLHGQFVRELNLDQLIIVIQNDSETQFYVGDIRIENDVKIKWLEEIMIYFDAQDTKKKESIVQTHGNGDVVCGFNRVALIVGEHDIYVE